MKPLKSITIVGVGLIGGSIGLAARSRGVARRVVGLGSRAETLAAARELGAIDTIATEPADGVAEAELVVVCTPVGTIADWVCQLAPLCQAGTLITDAGSTKAGIVAAVEAAAADPAWPREVRFIGSHPLAGNEKKGPRHAAADLFVDRTVVITPTPRAATRTGGGWPNSGKRWAPVCSK